MTPLSSELMLGKIWDPVCYRQLQNVTPR